MSTSHAQKRAQVSTLPRRCIPKPARDRGTARARGVVHTGDTPRTPSTYMNAQDTIGTARACKCASHTTRGALPVLAKGMNALAKGMHALQRCCARPTRVATHHVHSPGHSAPHALRYARSTLYIPLRTPCCAPLTGAIIFPKYIKMLL